VTERPHGTRARYVFGPTGNDTRNGCRCFECSGAAVLYEKRRQAARARGEVAYVDAGEARSHLAFLRSNGIGLRTIAQTTALSRSQLTKIANGRTSRIRPATADKILGVHLGKASDGTYVDAGPTLAHIADLVERVGMTRTQIAKALGYRTHALQIAKTGRVTKANAAKVEALWRERMAPIHARRENARTTRAHYRQLQREAS